jgi:alkaline phosphatase D
MQRVVASGTALARPESAHAVHVDVAGLRPGRTYWYRFSVDDGSSPIGRTRTAPVAGANNASLDFAFVSCQHYENGHYTAYQHLAEEDLELVLHLGDYIYEGGPSNDRVRRHNGPEIKHLMTIGTVTRSTKAINADRGHSLFPWAVVWDDHEVDNNYAGIIPEATAPIEEFTKRRNTAIRRVMRHMPLRRSVLIGVAICVFTQGSSTLARSQTFYMLDATVSDRSAVVMVASRVRWDPVLTGR